MAPTLGPSLTLVCPADIIVGHSPAPDVDSLTEAQPVYRERAGGALHRHCSGPYTAPHTAPIRALHRTAPPAPPHQANCAALPCLLG